MSSKKTKRDTDTRNEPASKRPTSTIVGISRSISACQRCRLKKVRCDQNFPRCAKCAKAGVECVGLDSATGREVPRSYVIYLEDKIAILEGKLKEKDVELGMSSEIKPNGFKDIHTTSGVDNSAKEDRSEAGSYSKKPSENSEGISSNISFVRLVTTALKFNKKMPANSNSINDPTISMKPESIRPALLPPKKTAIKFLEVFFAQSNSQLPILHREEFIRDCFVPVYGDLGDDISFASNYTAINRSIFEDRIVSEENTWLYQYKKQFQQYSDLGIHPSKMSEYIVVPKVFHKALFFLNLVFAIASSVHHLQYPKTISDSFKVAAMKYVDVIYSSNDQLQSLSGILLLSFYSIMRPGIPGVWYLLGTALRVCVDLGLHNELGSQRSDLDSFTKDKRRRLFWCTYSLDRQVCFYLNRPIGIPDESITTPFPSDLDDALMIPNDKNNADYSENISGMPTYKSISLTFLRIRQIQSDAHRILYDKCELPRKFKDIDEWKEHITRKLESWKQNVPKTSRKMNCDFNLAFFSLNYYHTLLYIHGISPRCYKLSEQDFQIVYNASKGLIQCYSQLYSTKSINYTWAAVHNLFMAGTSYLYAIYNSEKLSLPEGLMEVKKITSECLNVLTSLIDTCDAANTCKDIFENLAMVIIKLKFDVKLYRCSTAILNEKYQNYSSAINPNLSKLMETLNESNDAEDDEQEQQSRLAKELNPFDKEQSEVEQSGYALESQEMIQSLLNTSNNESSDNSVRDTFEWISDNDQLMGQNSGPNENGINNGVPATDHHDIIERFFEELENESQKSGGSKTDSDNVFIKHNSSETSAQDYNPFNYQNKSPNSSNKPIYPKDGKRIFELLQQMPTESIWDEFFTTGSSTTSINFNTGFSPK